MRTLRGYKNFKGSGRVTQNQLIPILRGNNLIVVCNCSLGGMLLFSIYPETNRQLAGIQHFEFDRKDICLLQT